MKIQILALAAFFASVSHATEMDAKAKVYTTVNTPFSGMAEVTCENPAGWKFDVKASNDNGRDVVTVKISSPTEATPPKFGVFPSLPVENSKIVFSTKPACVFRLRAS